MTLHLHHPELTAGPCDPELAAALRPFAKFAGLDLSETAWANASEETPVLYHHATGIQITLGDFLRARAALKAAGIEG